MPTLRWDFGVIVVGSQILAIGGRNKGRALPVVEALDTETNTWSTLAPMPTPRREMAIAVIGHKVWVMGGYNDRDLDVIEVFHSAKNEWSTSRFRLPIGCPWAKAVVVNGKIYITGGRNLSSVVIFDPKTGQWKQAPPMKTPRLWHGVVAY
jgi:hypothetical protein